MATFRQTVKEARKEIRRAAAEAGYTVSEVDLGGSDGNIIFWLVDAKGVELSGVQVVHIQTADGVVMSVDAVYADCTPQHEDEQYPVDYLVRQAIGIADFNAAQREAA